MQKARHTPKPDVVFELARRLDPLLDDNDRLNVYEVGLPSPLSNADLDAIEKYWDAHCGWLEDSYPQLAREFEQQLQRAIDKTNTLLDEAVRVLNDDELK